MDADALREGVGMTRATWSRALLVVLVLSFFPLPVSATHRPAQARAEEKLGFLAAVWHVAATLVPSLEKLGPGMDPLGSQGKTPPPPPQTSGGDLGPGMDPLG
jgi:hypothetical protein